LHKVTEVSTLLIKDRTKILKEIIEYNKLLDFGNQDMYKDEDDNERDKIVEERNKLKELLDV